MILRKGTYSERDIEFQISLYQNIVDSGRSEQVRFMFALIEEIKSSIAGCLDDRVQNIHEEVREKLIQDNLFLKDEVFYGHTIKTVKHNKEGRENNYEVLIDGKLEKIPARWYHVLVQLVGLGIPQNDLEGIDKVFYYKLRKFFKKGSLPGIENKKPISISTEEEEDISFNGFSISVQRKESHRGGLSYTLLIKQEGASVEEWKEVVMTGKIYKALLLLINNQEVTKTQRGYYFRLKKILPEGLLDNVIPRVKER